MSGHFVLPNEINEKSAVNKRLIDVKKQLIQNISKNRLPIKT